MMNSSVRWRFFLLFAVASPFRVDADEVVIVTPYSEQRAPMPIEVGPTSMTLRIRPQSPHRLAESHIADMDDAALWKAGAKTPQEHRYHIVNAYSSQEYVHIDGKVTRSGPGSSSGGGNIPPFHVTVPAVDLDWIVTGEPQDEAAEETTALWVTDQTNQTFVVHCPQESRDDMFQWQDGDKLPDMTLLWSPDLEVFSDGARRLSRLQSPHRISHSEWTSYNKKLFFKVSRNKDVPLHQNNVQTIRLEREYTKGDENSNVTFDEIKYQFLEVDLDVDSLNRWGNDYFTDDVLLPEIDRIEESTAPWKSKIIFVNNIDKDGDEVPDFMDGWNCPVSQIPVLEREIKGKRSSNTAEHFVPMLLNIKAPDADPSKIRIRFKYPASDPKDMRLDIVTWTIDAGPTQTELVADTSKSNKIRIWTKDGNSKRSRTTDFVVADKIYTLDELEIELNKPKVFYIEGINASENWGDVEVIAEVSIDAGVSWTASDRTRLTCMVSNLGICVVRQFYHDGVFENRKLYAPDYSTPAKFLEKELNCYTLNYKALSSPLAARSAGFDTLWHDGDAMLGHGFAFIQYDGPDIPEMKLVLEDLISMSNYDSKIYYDKTGSCGIGTYGEADFAEAESLAWWDICPYQIENKWLVLKQVTTLHPGRLVAINNTFKRYRNLDPNKFGLNIDMSINGWGCLSNVGLVLKDPMCQPHVNKTLEECEVIKTLPSIANEDVIKFLVAAPNFAPSSIKKLLIAEKLSAAVVRAATATTWGEVASTSIYEQLISDFTEALEGIYDHSGNLIDRSYIIKKIGSAKDECTDLHYYDPGLFPKSFGENPKDAFDVRPPSN